MWSTTKDDQGDSSMYTRASVPPTRDANGDEPAAPQEAPLSEGPGSQTVQVDYDAIMADIPRRRCEACGRGWHRLSIWMFRLLLPLILTQALLTFLLTTVVFGMVLSVLAYHRPPEWVLMTLSYVLTFLPIILLSGMEAIYGLVCAISMQKEFFPCSVGHCQCCRRCCFDEDTWVPVEIDEEGTRDIEMANTAASVDAERSGSRESRVRRMLQVRQRREGCLYWGGCWFPGQFLFLFVMAVFITMVWLFYAMMVTYGEVDANTFLAVPLIKTITWVLYAVALIIHRCSSIKPSAVGRLR